MIFQKDVNYDSINSLNTLNPGYFICTALLPAQFGL